MNQLELKMVDTLKDLKEKHGAISVRAAFEAEGTKLDELLRLKDISLNAGLGLNLKIGGCESIRDMIEANIVGVDYLVAPTVESAYALRKYLQAVKKVFPQDELDQMQVFSNLDSKVAIEDLDEMLQIPEIGVLNGFMIGRVDICYSMGLDDQSMDNPEVAELVAGAAKKIRSANLKACIGGGVSSLTLPFLEELSVKESTLDFFQTRKVLFDAGKAFEGDPQKGILKALKFEFLWLENKLTYSKTINAEDKKRMRLIEDQYLKTVDVLI